MKLALALAGCLALTICASASPSAAGRQHVSAIAFTVGAAPVRVETQRAIPARPDVSFFVKFNGHDPQSCWADSQLEFECGWHGVIVTVTGRHRRSRATVRAASVRADVVRVYVRLTW